MVCLNPAELSMLVWSTASDENQLMGNILEISGFSYAWPDSPGWLLQDVSLRIAAGQCCCLTGPTGSGKSTLALACKDLLPVGRRAGSIDFPSGQPRVGLVMQNPENQLFATTLGEEVAFALENRGVVAERMPAQVRAALAAVGLDLPLDCPTGGLSMGQKYRVLLAAVLVMQPQLLILDEPAAQLDSDGLGDLRRVLSGLMQQGVAVLLCEHRPQVFSSLIDTCWQLSRAGRLLEKTVIAESVSTVPNAASGGSSEQGDVLIQAEGLSAGIDRSQPLWQRASFTVKAGQSVFVQGANGAGKSTLLRVLSGLEAPLEGEVKVFGRKPTLSRVRGRLGILLQNPQRQLFADRVIDEVAFPLQRSGLSGEKQQTKAKAVLSRCGIAELGECSPHQLSYGQKHLVALASVLAIEPQLLLLDDPFAGLDKQYRQRVWQALEIYNRKYRTTIVWTSHHEEEIPAFADQLLTIKEGQLVSRSIHH